MSVLWHLVITEVFYKISQSSYSMAWQITYSCGFCPCVEVRYYGIRAAGSDLWARHSTL